jgi:hypothetical protein
MLLFPVPHFLLKILSHDFLQKYTYVYPTLSCPCDLLPGTYLLTLSVKSLDVGKQCYRSEIRFGSAFSAVLRNRAILPRFRFRFRVPNFLSTVPVPAPAPVPVPVPTLKF